MIRWQNEWGPCRKISVSCKQSTQERCDRLLGSPSPESHLSKQLGGYRKGCLKSSSIRPKWSHIKLIEQVYVITLEFSLSSPEYLSNLHGWQNAFIFMIKKKKEKNYNWFLNHRHNKSYQMHMCAHVPFVQI